MDLTFGDCRSSSSSKRGEEIKYPKTVLPPKSPKAQNAIIALVQLMACNEEPEEVMKREIKDALYNCNWSLLSDTGEDEYRVLQFFYKRQDRSMLNWLTRKAQLERVARAENLKEALDEVKEATLVANAGVSLQPKSGCWPLWANKMQKKHKTTKRSSSADSGIVGRTPPRMMRSPMLE